MEAGESLNAMAKIDLPQLKTTLKLKPGRSLMAELLAHGVPVASSCQGDGICGKCRMKVFSEKPLSPTSPQEEKTLQNIQAETDERLSCQMLVEHDLKLKTTYW